MEKKMTLGIILTLITVLVAMSIYMVYCANKPLEQEVIVESDSFTVSDEILISSGWIGSESVDMVSEPSESGEVVGSLVFNEKIEYTIYNSDWYKVENFELTGYIPASLVLNEDTGYTSYEQYVLDKIVGYTEYDVPSTSGFKSYMDYRAITSTGSRQYKLQNRYAETGDYGIRMVNGRYCVAIGSYFSSNIGQYFDLILENGTVIPCILADQKADVDTDSNNIITVRSGCASEFVVDTNCLDSIVLQMGNVSYAEENWNSPVSSVKLYNKNVFDE